MLCLVLLIILPFPKVWASVISMGPRNYPLNASYKTADVYAFQVFADDVTFRFHFFC